jgi:diguanylate cyclase (GGDEF)-like protein
MLLLYWGDVMIEMAGYKLNEMMHQGDSSTLYRGIRKADNQNVVLKVLDKKLPTTEDITRFRREFILTKTFNNTGVIKAHELITDNNALCMVLEDFGGESLDRIMHDGALTLSQFLEIALSIVDSLELIHERQIIHKNITPSNIAWNKSTKEVKILDFGLSTELSRENLEVKNPDILEGTLAFMSPEQTGRMNRSLDYRTDFYSLGATFYKLLTGRPPFEGKDAMEIVYNHIAVEATPPSAVQYQDENNKTEKAAFQNISNIIMKLMAKAAEDRYQSTFGLKQDLLMCFDQLNKEDSDDILELIPGQNDISEHFHIPQRLYGREHQTQLLMESFKRVQTGITELLLVTGYSGIGKTVFINEIHKPVTEKRGCFIKGKFDQFNRDIPYSAFTQAISELVKHILSESEQKIGFWKKKLLKELGSNGQIVVDMVPELELIIGRQPNLSKLGLDETRNRFKTTIQNFIGALGDTKNPVVIFLDDLQWADSASLKLIELTMTDLNVKGLLFIGAYRDNELDPAHPLLDTLDNIRKENLRLKEAGISFKSDNVHTIVIEPLELACVLQLCCDTMNRKPEEVQEFAKLILKKTRGNPFFINQLLYSLYTDKIINFIHNNGKWEWEHKSLVNYHISDNVVDLMINKIKSLPNEMQQMLQLASCAGHTFNLDSLSVISKKSKKNISKILWKLLKEEIIEPVDETYQYMEFDQSPEISSSISHTTQSNPSYSFIHDRIRQAAYLMMNEKEKQNIHLAIGRLIYKQAVSVQDSIDESLADNALTVKQDLIFDIVNHYNKGIQGVVDRSEKELIARLNLKAGKKALQANAYKAALNYLNTGLSVIEKSDWDLRYDLTLALYTNTIKALYFNFEFKKIYEISAIALGYITNIVEQVEIYEVIMKSLYTQEKVLDVIDTGRELLKKFKLNLPQHPNKMHILLEFMKTKWVLRGKTIHSLKQMPLMTDPQALAVCRILTGLISSAYVAHTNLAPILSLKLIQLSVKYGNYPSAQIYPFFGLMNLLILNNIDACYKYGKLGLELSSKDEFNESKVENILMFYAFNYHWKKSISKSISKFLEGYRVGIENGDFEYACWCLHCPDFTAVFSGHNLMEQAKVMDNHRKRMIQLRQQTILNIYSTVHQSVSNLIGDNEDPQQLTGRYMNEKKLLENLDGRSFNTTIASVYFWKTILNFIFHNYDSAVKNSAGFEKYTDAHAGLSSIPIFYYISSLARLAFYQNAAIKEKSNLIGKVSRNLRKLKKWARHASVNHMHKWHLVKAELARIKGNNQPAITHYEKAVSNAKQSHNLWEEALSFELFARFWIEQGNKELGFFFMQNAYNCYFKWGALAKIRHMQEQYPEIGFESKEKKSGLHISQPKITEFSMVQPENTFNNTSSCVLDLVAILKAFHTISGEIKLEHLLTKIMQLVIENAGAKKGFLILPKANRWSIEAASYKDIKKIKVLESIPLFHGSDEKIDIMPLSADLHLSLGIAKYVIRTQKAVVLENAVHKGNFIHDEYVIKNRPKSVLCLPLLNQGKLNGILYLENNLSTGVFTDDRLQVLSMISTQAAISLENARMYLEVNDLNKNLELKVKERTKELHTKNKEISEINAELKRLSITDRLTGLYNRNKLDEVLNYEYERATRYDCSFSLIIIDIDHFKSVNDTYGHHVGDTVLIEFSKILHNTIRKIDTVGRWGGEEFVIICPDTLIEGAVSVAEKTRKKVESHVFPIVNHKTISLGVAAYKKNETIDDIIKRADENLYCAKNNGRNKVKYS